MRFPVAMILALGVAPALLGDPPAPGPDSLAAARKDFASIKAATAPSDGVSNLPTLDMKDMGPAPGLAMTAPTPIPTEELSLDPSKKKTGATGNWLVDAMDKKDDRTRSSKPGDDLLKADSDTLAEPEKAGSRGAKDAPASADSREKADSRETPEQVYNPLDSFMSGWISAHDHDLLVPSTKGEGLAENDPGRGRVDALPGADAATPASPSEGLLPESDAGGWADVKAESNPYLALLDTVEPAPAKMFTASEVPGYAPLDLADSPQAMTSSGIDSRPIDTSRSFIPDFAQPDDDDKYFPQMKRF
jgi:hypothetical protein